LLTTPRY
jgi:hypothetical protein